VITFARARQRQSPKVNIFFSMFFISFLSFIRYRAIYGRIRAATC
jgi:hypothetical protein